MKNTITRIKIAILLLLIGGISCTHNNGDIGPLFGKWKLETLEIDGKIDTNYKGNIFFGFQNDVTNMILVDEYSDFDQRFGHWNLTGDNLMIIYDDYRYVPFTQTHFIAGTNHCKVKTLNDKELIFTLSNDDHIYTYKFIKW